MKNLYLEKLKRMSLSEIMDECEQHGKRMERGHMDRDEKKRAFICFKFASEQEGLAADKEMLLVALRVLKIL
jgi:hypothetical protein